MSLATFVAADIENKIQIRQHLLDRLAAALPEALEEGHGAPDRLVRTYEEIAPLFSQGLVVVGADGHAVLAQSPLLPGRTTIDYGESDWFIAARTASGVAIGKPFRGRLTGKPLLAMARAVRGPSGTVIAVVAGVSDLDAPGFLDLLQTVHIGKGGGLLLVSPRDHLFVAASDPRKTLTPTPAQSLNPLHDRAMAGYRGTGVTINAEGGEDLAAIVSVPTPGWFLVARLPTAEAFHMVRDVRGLILGYAIAAAGTLVVVFLLILPRLLRPLSDAARQIRAMADGRRPLDMLPVAHQDEVGELCRGFNILVTRLREKERELRASEARMAHMAHHDGLTALPNRALFDKALEWAVTRADRQGTSFALLFLDLDGFKPVNDTWGHEIGDIALRYFADRLRHLVRASDTLARLGGDEFVILLGDLERGGRAVPERVAQACLAAMAEPFQIGDLVLTLGLSIGIALYPDDGCEPGLLISRADQAMYTAKRTGRGRYVFFDAAKETI